MVPQGPPNPLGGSQPIPPSLLRSNSNLLGGQAGSQNAFSQQNQFNMNMVGNGPNVSSLLQQSFGNGGQSSQRGLIANGADSDQLSSVGNGMGFNHSSSSCISSSNAMNSGHVQSQQQLPSTSGNQTLMDQQHAQRLDPHNFQNNQQFQSMRAGLGGLGPVKLEQQVMHDQTSQQLQTLRNLGSVKLEPQQLPSMRNLATVKVEPQHSDTSLLLQQQHQQQQQQQQQKQQQQLLLSRQSSQAAAAAQILQQQRLMQIQQQQLLKSVPQQRSPMQAQLQLQSLPIRSPVKPVYEPGMCARRLTHYMYQQQHRPEDNNIEFWRKFVAEYFAPNAKKKWCVSMYGSCRQTTGVFPQAVWHCEICNRKPGRGFEATFEVLPRLFKIKYESGTLEELLYIDMPREYQNSSGQIVLDYAKAIQESVFEQLRVVRDGQLRIVFSSDLKICSWEFCARRHEELIPRRLLIPQVGQLGAAAQKYQTATQSASSNPASPELQSNYNMFVASARQLAKSLEVPLVNDLGYTKRYVRCLQISEVVNSMKDLIDYSRETGSGPMESLAKFPRPTNPSPGLSFQGQPQQFEAQSKQQQQQPIGHNLNNDNMQLTSTNGLPNTNNTMNSGPTTPSNNTNIGLLHQNSMNSRQQNTISGLTGHSGGNNVPPQPNAASFQLPTPSSSTNPQQSTHGGLSGDVDTNDTQSSVQKILHDMMMSSTHIGGGGMMNGDARNGVTNGNSGFGGFGHSNAANGTRQVPGNNSVTMNGRVGMMMAREPSMNQPQQELSNQLLGIGSVNGFNDLQFDWKSSP